MGVFKRKIRRKILDSLAMISATELYELLNVLPIRRDISLHLKVHIFLLEQKKKIFQSSTSTSKNVFANFFNYKNLVENIFPSVFRLCL